MRDGKQRIPIIQTDIREAVLPALAPPFRVGPQFHEGEGYAAAAQARVKHIDTVHAQVAAIEVLSRPGCTDDIRDAGGDLCIFDEDVADGLTLHGKSHGAVPLPSALQ